MDNTREAEGLLLQWVVFATGLQCSGIELPPKLLENSKSVLAATQEKANVK